MKQKNPNKHQQSFIAILGIVFLLVFLVYTLIDSKHYHEEIDNNSKETFGIILCYKSVSCNSCSSNKVCYKFRVKDTIYLSGTSGYRPKDLSVGDMFKIEYSEKNPIMNRINFLKPVSEDTIWFMLGLNTIGNCECGHNSINQ